MSVLRLIIAAVAVVFGLIVAAVLAVIGVVAFCIARLFGLKGPKASFKFNVHRGGPAAQPRPRASRMNPDGAIDIEATEIENHPEPRKTLE